MNQNTIIGGIVVIILAVLGIWYFSSNTTGTAGQDQTATTSDSTGTTGTTAGTAANPNTFRSIFTQSGNHVCTYAQVTASGQSSNAVYIADGKMRGEFRTVSGTGTLADLMIYTGGILYSWKEGATVGKKSSIKSLADLPQAIPGDLTSGAILGFSLDNVSWDCHDWARDVKLFVIPAYVTFS